MTAEQQSSSPATRRTDDEPGGEGSAFFAFFGHGLIARGLWPVGTVVLICSVWEIIARLGFVAAIIFPPPSAIAGAAVRLYGEPYFWEAMGVTTWETVAGFVLGSSLGWGLGTIIALSDRVRSAIYPLVIAFQNTPRIVFAPLFLTWFGFGLTSKVVMATVICFFPVVIAVIVGIETTDDDAMMLMRSYGASRWDIYRRLWLPTSMPIIFAGFKTAITLALVGAIVGEFVGAAVGIGVLIKTFTLQLNVAEGFAAILALAVLGLLLYGLVEFADRKLIYWRAK